MLVKHRLHINVIFSTVSAIVILVMFSAALYRINQLNQAAKAVDEIITDAFERVALRNDYILNNNVRARTQWFLKHADIGQELQQAYELFRGDDKKTVALMLKDQESIGRIFSLIMTNRETGAAQAGKAAAEAEERLISQLNMRVYNVVIHGRELLESARTARARAINRTGIVIALLLVAVVSASAINARSMGRTITRRVRKLRDSAATIGEGDLEHHIELDGNDEFNDIADALNTMTTKLRASHLALTNEIEERTRIEEELLRSRSTTVTLLEETEAARHRAEASIAELETIFGAIQDAVLIYDTDMNVCKVNQTFFPTYGFDPVGCNLRDIVARINCRTLDNRVLAQGELPTRRALQGETVLNQIFRVTRQDGVKAVLETSSTPLYIDKRIAGCVTVWHDVSKRIKAERALRESEERYRGLVELAPFAIFINRNNCIEYINPAGIRLFGAAGREEIIGRTPFDFIHPDDHPDAADRVKRLLRGGSAEAGLTRIIQLNSKIRIVEVVATSCIDSQGVAIQIMMNDITERKLTEDALMASEESLRFHLDNSPLAVIEWDKDFIVTRWTGRAEQIFGWSADEVTGTPLTELDMVFEADIPLVLDVMQRLKDGSSGQIVSSNRNYTKSREVRYCTWYNSVHLDEQGAMTSVLSKVIDITEQKRAEERIALLATTAETLLGSETPQQDILALCQQAMATLNCHAFFNFLVDKSQGRLHLNAWSGITIEEAGDIEWLDYGVAICGCVARDGCRLVAEDIPNRTDPRTELVESYGIKAYACHPIMAGDEVLGTISFGSRSSSCFSEEDLALMKAVADLVSIALQRKRSEEQLRQAHDLLEEQVTERTRELHDALTSVQREMYERLSAEADAREKERMLIQQGRQAALGEMIGNIAHQWRQPLNNLALLIQQMKQFYKAGRFDATYLESSVAKGMSLVNHMSQTIDDFRLFFRPDKQPVEFCVADAVTKSIELIRDGLLSQQVAIETELEPEVTISGFPNEFAQSILNILINAKDAHSERRTTAPRIAVRSWCENGRCVVTITDNAGGIADEIIANIFDPYFSTKGPQQGTGIGLFMTRTIIEKNMGGTICVRNTGDGAEFRIEV